MVKLTQSLQEWLWRNHKDIIGLIMFGHTELFTSEMQKDVLQLRGSKGKAQIIGGNNYDAV